MKKYIVTDHAKQRSMERLGQPESNAAQHLIDLMQTAYYRGDTSNSKGNVTQIYDHYRSETRLVTDGDKIVTVYKFPDIQTVEPNKVSAIPFMDEVAQVIKRKFAKSERDFKRKERALSIELAEYNLELAQHRLSFAKAKSPKVRASLTEKITEVETMASRIQFELDEATKAFNAIKEGAAAYL